MFKMGSGSGFTFSLTKTIFHLNLNGVVWEFEKMKKQFWLITILCLVSFAGCAYFNVFFNAKKYYKKGYHETLKNRTGKVTGGERTNYQKAAEKASKLITLYPNSKYVDDALLLMSKSYYYCQEYLKSQRKLEELITNYPESEFVEEAHLWMAKTDLAMEKYDNVEESLIAILDSEASEKLKGEANYCLGKLYYEQKSFQNAVDAYQKSLDADVKDLKLETMYAIGVNYDSLGVYDKAAEYFEQIVKANPILEFRFDAEFNYAQMVKKQRRFEDAMRLFEQLLGEERNKKWIPDLELEIAECLALQGDIDGAIMAYQDVVQTHKRSAHSARAYYRLGQIYEEHRKDYERALDSFKQVKTEFRQSELADSAETRSRDIQRLQALIQVIQMVQKGEGGEMMVVEEEVQEDSLTDEVLYAMIDSSSTDSSRYNLLLNVAGKAFVDSVMFERYPFERENRMEMSQRLSRRNRRDRDKEEQMDWKEWIQEGEVFGDTDLFLELRALERSKRQLEKRKLTDNPEFKTFRPEELDKNLFLLAELYLFRFLLPDSARSQYLRLLDEFPESPFTPQALYNLGYIAREIDGETDEEEKYLRQLIQDFPDSHLSNVARINLGLISVSTKRDSIQRRFQEAENILLVQNDPIRAFNKYEMIWEEFPDSEFAPKAAYAMAWIGETYMDSLQLAYVLYDSLMKRYPNTVYATSVKQKVDTYEREKQREKEEEKAKLEAAAKDTTALKAPIRGNETEKAVAVSPDSSDTSVRMLIDTKRVVEPLPGDSAKMGIKDVKPKEEKLQEMDEHTEASPIGGITAIRRRLVIPEELDAEKIPAIVEVEVHVDARGDVIEVSLVTPVEDNALIDAIQKAIQQTKFRAARRGRRSTPSRIKLSIPTEKLTIVE